jgi:hypothetical protein
MQLDDISLIYSICVRRHAMPDDRHGVTVYGGPRFIPNDASPSPAYDNL